jgi:anti-anti-sigma regulatory factor
VNSDNCSVLQLTAIGTECLVVVLRGPVDRSTTSTCRALLHAAVDAGTRLLLMDVSAVEPMPRGMIEVLVDIQRDIHTRGGQILVEGARSALPFEPDLAEVFATYRRTVTAREGAEHPTLACAV